MTYNFDPDGWYDREYAALELLFKKGKLDKYQFEKALLGLEKRYDEMLDRLDGTYELP